MPLRQCSSAHCSGADAEINEICKQEGWPVNHPVLTRDAQGPCICSCSCLAHDTPVQIAANAFKAIQYFQLGDSVLAAGKTLEWKEHKVVFSQGTTGASRQKFTVLVTYSDTFLVVTSDHLFVLANGKLKPASKLNTEDKLVTPDGRAVTIKALHIGDYTGGFHHIATSKSEPNENLDGHLLNTNGVVSGDYAVQLFYRVGDLKASLPDDEGDLPIIGSPEYVAKWGDVCLRAPQPISALRVSNSSAPDRQIGDISTPLFVPAEQTVITVPTDAASFISEEEARQKGADPKRAWNDPLSREWTEYLIGQHRAFYPNVIYHLDWADNTVNAYAWIENGVRHVALKGGLVRHVALELEGIALVLAHELAHHYGGDPTFPGGLSCEGQADYRGVRNVMRVVWFGEQYIAMTDRGIQQMANFFGVPNDPTPPSGSAGCSHPPGPCRIATYHAAVTLAGKSNCAS